MSTISTQQLEQLEQLKRDLETVKQIEPKGFICYRKKEEVCIVLSKLIADLESREKNSYEVKTSEVVASNPGVVRSYDVLPKKVVLVPRLPPNYKSIEYYQTQFSIPEGAKFTSDIKEDLFVNDPSFMPFLSDHFSTLEIIRGRVVVEYRGRDFTMPNICLVSVTDKKEPMYKAQELLQKKLPCLETAVYTAEGIRVSRDGRNPVMLTTTFSAYLQSIKDDFIRGLRSLNNILVFAGDSAERGVSFVSSDYEWHPNYMRILAPDNRIVSECVQQAVRLTGDFNDSISLYLCCTEKFKKKVYAGYVLQKEMALNLKKSIEEEKKKSYVEEKVEEKKEGEEKDCLLILEYGLSPREKETYNLILDYFEHNRSNGWVMRTTINNSMGDLGTTKYKDTRLNNLQKKSLPATSSCKGLLFKKEGSRWKLKLNL